METVIIKYNASVCKPCGWRSEVVTAKAEKISEKRARVIEVLDISGYGNTGYSTGSNRQKFNIGGIAKREEGKIKILSKCEIVADV